MRPATDLNGRAVQIVADWDRAEAAFAEAERCGCRVEVPRDDHGRLDFGRLRVKHRRWRCSRGKT